LRFGASLLANSASSRANSTGEQLVGQRLPEAALVQEGFVTVVEGFSPASRAFIAIRSEMFRCAQHDMAIRTFACRHFNFRVSFFRPDGRKNDTQERYSTMLPQAKSL